MKRTVLILTWIFISTVLCSAQTTFYFPQIADGIQSDGITWKTTIFITNPAAAGTSTASGTITFTTSAGGPFSISFVDGSGATVGSGNTIPFSISGGQARKYVSSGSGALSVGYAVVNSSAPITGTAVFSEFTAGGGLISEAGVPSAAASTRQAIFVDTQSGFNTGVAVANPNAGPTTITLQLLSSQGVTVVATPATQPLAGNQHTAAFVSQLFPSAPAFAGTMLIDSQTPLAAIALRFSPSGLFTTLPPIPIASLLYPAVQWLEARLWLSPFTSVAKLLAGLQFSIG
jgi:hypothetical protein